MNKRRISDDALEILDRMIGGDAEIRRAIEEETVFSRVASQIYDARTEAGLTQQQLADLSGTTQSVIARLESLDYEGHSLSMIVRVADALDCNIAIALIPKRRRA